MSAGNLKLQMDGFSLKNLKEKDSLAISVSCDSVGLRQLTESRCLGLKPLGGDTAGMIFAMLEANSGPPPRDYD